LPAPDNPSMREDAVFVYSPLVREALMLPQKNGHI
jgi:hypothetical protein